MNADFTYPQPPLLAGILLRRYQRFFAEVELASGEVVTAHCANTGPMTGVCTPGSPVLVSRSDNPKRKLAYTLEAIQVQELEPTWVGINTSLPNRVVKQMLLQRSLPLSYGEVRSEVRFGVTGKSRVDFWLGATDTEPPLFLEVKSTTWAEQGVARFPDTVTERGQKHLRDLMHVLPTARAAILYFINRGDCERFEPGDRADPVYGNLLRQAVAAGVQVLPCRFVITPSGLGYLGLAELCLEPPP